MPFIKREVTENGLTMPTGLGDEFDDKTNWRVMDNVLNGVASRYRKKVVIDGDSLGDFMDGGDGSTYYQYGHRSWATHALAEIGWIYEVVAVPATGGQTMQQILARFASSVEAYMPSEVWMIPCQNNLGDVDGGAAAIAALTEYAKRCKALGILFRCGTVTPRYGSFFTTQCQTNHMNINRAIADMARQGLLKMFNSSKAIADPLSATGSALAGILFDEATSGIHPSPKGCYRIARQFARDFAGEFSGSIWQPVLSNLDCRQVNASSRQLFMNPKMIDSGVTTAGIEGLLSGTPSAAVAGVAPDYMQLSLVRNGTTNSVVVTGTANVPDTADTGRLFYQMAFTGTKTDGATDVAVLNLSAQMANMLGPVVPGVDSVDYARITIKGSNVSSNFAYAEFSIEALNVSVVLWSAKCPAADSAYTLGEFSDKELVFHVPGFLIPANTTRLRANLKLGYNAGACAGTFLVTDMDVRLKSAA